MAYQRRGTQREHQVCDELASRGYRTIDSRGSHGPVDVVALRKDRPTLAIQVKSDQKKYGPFANFGPKDREELREWAKAAGAIPLLIWWPPYGGMTWIPVSGWPSGRQG
jgi:Holliday junction resolvase